MTNVTCNPAADAKVAEIMTVHSFAIACPYCGEDQHGWVSDPRGTSQVCDDCGGHYQVSEGLQIKF